MLAIFTLLATVMQECGFPSALINRKEIKHDDYNAVFWFSLLVSLACYAVLFCCAPLIARYFHQPVLTRLSRVTFLSFILVALGTSHRTYLSKKLMIREMAMVNILAVVISGTVGVSLQGLCLLDAGHPGAGPQCADDDRLLDLLAVAPDLPLEFHADPGNVFLWDPDLVHQHAGHCQQQFPLGFPVA